MVREKTNPSNPSQTCSSRDSRDSCCFRLLPLASLIFLVHRLTVTQLGFNLDGAAYCSCSYHPAPRSTSPDSQILRPSRGSVWVMARLSRTISTCEVSKQPTFPSRMSQRLRDEFPASSASVLCISLMDSSARERSDITRMPLDDGLRQSPLVGCWLSALLSSITHCNYKHNELRRVFQEWSFVGQLSTESKGKFPRLV